MANDLKQKIQNRLESTVRDSLLSDYQRVQLFDVFADVVDDFLGDPPEGYSDKAYDFDPHPFDELLNNTTNAVVELIVNGVAAAAGAAAQAVYDAVREAEALRFHSTLAVQESDGRSPGDAVTRVGDFHQTCSCCGRTFEAAQWARLQDLGVQEYPDGIALELRNCPCGSTISLTLVDRYGALEADLKELEETRS